MPLSEYVDDDQLIDALVRLYRAGECDDADGGVASRTIASAAGVSASTVNKHLKGDDRAESVWGIGPNGPRQSWVPTVASEHAPTASHAEADD